MQHPIDNSGDEPLSNFSNNAHFHEIVAQQTSLGESSQHSPNNRTEESGTLTRRGWLKGGAGLALMEFMGINPVAAAVKKTSAQKLRFNAIGVSFKDEVIVPKEFTATPFVPWGTPITAKGPVFKADASNSGADQELQVGSHHDGMHFFPMDAREKGVRSDEGLLVMNHEYVDPTLLHPKGPTLKEKRPADEVRKEMAAHGVSVLHIRQDAKGEWQLVQDSPYSRRITGATPMETHGPVRGHDKLKTRYSPDGMRTRGTLNNCSHGVTPWGTYLAAEENWAGYFVNRDLSQPREHTRYGVPMHESRYRWETADVSDDVYQRFNATSLKKQATEDFRNEPNHFGWVTEIDPFDPQSVPRKRTALGRFAHEGVIFAPVRSGHPVVCYSGDDTVNEYVYKFVSAKPYDPKTAGGHLLDEGTLYVAHFQADGKGKWLPLDFHNPEFKAHCKAAGVTFQDQADVLLNTRLAADIVGATKMDRPEWGAVNPKNGDVYFSLSNNTSRTIENIHPANPRPHNRHGHIIRWTPEKGDHAQTQFYWDIFVMGGPPGTFVRNRDHEMTLNNDNHFTSPDGLWFDPSGTLWIQTDGGSSEPFGHNQMLAANPETGEIKRFLTGPVGAEITGATMTPDRRTLFINIQHPGEGSTINQFKSHWPDGGKSRPRSSTVIIRRKDGGLINS